MTLVAPRTTPTARPASRSARLLPLVLPGALLLTATAGALSMAGAHAEIVAAVQGLLAAR